MNKRTDDLGREAGIGFAVGVGICSMATLGVWLQYSSHVFTVWSGGAVSLAAGLIVGGAWYLLFRGRS
jgi:hypothetical protein